MRGRCGDAVPAISVIVDAEFSTLPSTTHVGAASGCFICHAVHSQGRSCSTSDSIQQLVTVAAEWRRGEVARSKYAGVIVWGFKLCDACTQARSIPGSQSLHGNGIYSDNGLHTPVHSVGQRCYYVQESVA